MSSIETTAKVESTEQPVAGSRVRPFARVDTGSQHTWKAHLVAVISVMLAVSAAYASVYFREDSIPGAIGANLVPAERVLEGEVPYRDFYKIQTPGVVLLNAALFKLFDLSLLTSLKGVLVFKVLTVVMVFVISRLIVPIGTALIPTLLSFLWLPPGGPFRPAPIQYEMLFILLALFFALRWLRSRRGFDVFAAGLSIGVVAFFKQNVGVYAALALIIVVVLEWRTRGRDDYDSSAIDVTTENRGALIFALAGMAVPLAGLFAYLVANGALGAAVQTFTQGPGEHFQMKFTGYPDPIRALTILIAGAVTVKAATAGVRQVPRLGLAIIAVTLLAASVCATLVPQSFVDNSIFWFPPVLFFYVAWVVLRKNRKLCSGSALGLPERRVLLVLLLFSIASYLEVFPRSVRGLLVGTLPPAFILLTFLLTRFSAVGEDGLVSGRLSPVFQAWRLKLAVVAIVSLIFAGRLIAPHYFSVTAGGLSFKADTQLSFDRGAGVYLPAERAAEVNATVEFVRARIEQDGYFFAHAIDATPYYFLADRKGPTRATLWNDAGTNDEERERTMQMLQDKDIRLVLTSAQAIAAERYQPLLELLERGFHETATIGKLKFLERNY